MFAIVYRQLYAISKLRVSVWQTCDILVGHYHVTVTLRLHG